MCVRWRVCGYGCRKATEGGGRGGKWEGENRKESAYFVSLRARLTAWMVCAVVVVSCMEEGMMDAGNCCAVGFLVHDFCSSVRCLVVYVNLRYGMVY